MYSKENTAGEEAMGDASHDDEEQPSRTDLGKLLLADMVLILLWIGVAVVIYTATEHASFLGLEGTLIKVTALIVGAVPTVSLLLFALDDVDELYMAVRTRRLRRRQRYHRALQPPDDAHQDMPHLGSGNDEETNRPA
jgi:hypothetical protein